MNRSVEPIPDDRRSAPFGLHLPLFALLFRRSHTLSPSLPTCLGIPAALECSSRRTSLLSHEACVCTTVFQLDMHPHHLFMDERDPDGL